MHRVLVVLLMFASIAYAMPTEVEMASILAQPAIGIASSESTFTVTVLGIIFDGYPELIGRSYSISLEKESDAFLVHTDGYLLSGYYIANQSLDQLKIYETIQEKILKDMGRIEHIREFGDAPTEQELNAYYEYATAKYGGKTNLTSWLFEKYNEYMLNVSYLSQEFKFKNGELTTSAEFIDSYKDVVLLKAEGANFPSVVLSSANESNNGDTVYVIESGSEDPAPAIIQIDGQGGVSTSQGNSPSIISDSSGKILALAFSNTNSALSSTELDSLLEKNGITGKDSKVNEAYKEGIVAYFEGDYTIAKEKFEEVLVSYPEHTGAKKNLQLTENEISDGNTDILSIISKLLKKVYTVSMELQLWIVLFAAFALAIILLRKNKRRK